MINFPTMFIGDHVFSFKLTFRICCTFYLQCVFSTSQLWTYWIFRSFSIVPKCQYKTEDIEKFEKDCSRLFINKSFKQFIINNFFKQFKYQYDLKILLFIFICRTFKKPTNYTKIMAMTMVMLLLTQIF